jgi:hypothetical protein
MKTINSYKEIKYSIQLLEAERHAKGQLLREQFLTTYDSFKLINIINSTIKDISSSPDLTDNIVGTATGIASGYITKKIIVGSSNNMFRKILGTAIQLGVTNFVAKHPDTIKNLSRSIINKVFHKKEEDTETLI